MFFPLRANNKHIDEQWSCYLTWELGIYIQNNKDKSSRNIREKCVKK